MNISRQSNLRLAWGIAEIKLVINTPIRLKISILRPREFPQMQYNFRLRSDHPLHFILSFEMSEWFFRPTTMEWPATLVNWDGIWKAYVGLSAYGSPGELKVLGEKPFFRKIKLSLSTLHPVPRHQALRKLDPELEFGHTKVKWLIMNSHRVRVWNIIWYRFITYRHPFSNWINHPSW